MGLVKLGLMESHLIGKTNIFVPVKDIQAKLMD
jgi:hypothetical protein